MESSDGYGRAPGTFHWQLKCYNRYWGVWKEGDEGIVKPSNLYIGRFIGGV